MLTLLASFAQEEGRSISENVKWGVRKRFQSGEIGAANKHILGHRYDDGLRKYVIIPEEAEAVRWISQMYIGNSDGTASIEYFTYAVVLPGLRYGQERYNL